MNAYIMYLNRIHYPDLAILVEFMGPKTHQLKEVQTFTVFIIKFITSEVHQFTVVKMALHVAIICITN